MSLNEIISIDDEDSDISATPDLSSDPGRIEEGGTTLYHGDLGTLTYDARRVLVHLLTIGSIDHSRHPNIWKSLIKNELDVKRRLSDLFLDLAIDYDGKVAFQVQADTGDLEAPKLLRTRQLTYYDSLLMLFLRQLLSHSEAQGAQPTVSIDQILDHMVVYDKSGNRHSIELLKRVEAAVSRANTKLGVLYKIGGREDLYEISRVLKLMLTADRVNALVASYSTIPSSISDVQNAIEMD